MEVRGLPSALTVGGASGRSGESAHRFGAAQAHVWPGPGPGTGGRCCGRENGENTTVSLRRSGRRGLAERSDHTRRKRRTWIAFLSFPRLRLTALPVETGQRGAALGTAAGTGLALCGGCGPGAWVSGARLGASLPGLCLRGVYLHGKERGGQAALHAPGCTRRLLKWSGPAGDRGGDQAWRLGCGWLAPLSALGPHVCVPGAQVPLFSQ